MIMCRLFAYGSLIWNPAFVYVEKCLARVHGFHRRFCLRTKIGRGSPTHPGYVLGLDRGGSCRGVVLRIAEENVASELEVVWRREMVTGAYVPTWVRAQSAGRTVRALTFVTNRRHPAYVGQLCDDAIAPSIATAVGPLGHCRDYLMRTYHGLSDAGIRDAYVSRIGERVSIGALLFLHSEAYPPLRGRAEAHSWPRAVGSGCARVRNKQTSDTGFISA